ncbi:MAG: YbaB/EbfC family nucleoid-associated protein [Thermoguttaceae bacterium]|nr:YbaB/EbfC family nucleoid-associated protein [Thermoguttaceae bacterium]MDW8037957.1 YbaB/EbfC family nucleoid-associated protein [Thermoguttaceae bacterium]
MGRKKKQTQAKKKSVPSAPPVQVELQASQEEFIDQLVQIHHQLEAKRVWGQAGGGLVKIEMNGIMQVLTCQLAPELLEKKDPELLEDLLISAFNDAVEKVKDQAFGCLASTLSDSEHPEALPEIPAVSAMAQFFQANKDLMAELGDPLITSLVELLVSLEDQEDEEDMPPKRRK